MEDIEVFCDRCGSQTSETNGVSYRTSHHNYNHVCSTCRNYLSRLDREKDRRIKNAKEASNKAGKKEWNKLKKRIYR